MAAIPEATKLSLLYRTAFRLRRPILASADLSARLCRGVVRALLFLRLGYRPSGDVSHDLKVKYPENLFLGRGVKISPGCSIGCFAPVRIEDDVTLSQDVIIESAGLDFRSSVREHVGRPVTIKEGAWLGARSIVLAGVTIGRGSVVGAGEVVRKDVPDGHIQACGVSRPIHA